MIHQIALATFLGFPLVGYLGVLTFSSFIFTASIGYSVHHGYKWVTFKWHFRMVIISFTIATIHAFFASSIIFGY